MTTSPFRERPCPLRIAAPLSGQARSRNAVARRGGALFEVMLSIALFAGAAAFTLGTMRAMLGNVDRAHREQQAADLARSKMAELHAGLIYLADLQAEQMRGVGTFEHFNEESGAQPLWRIDVSTARTEHTGLSLVTLTVSEDSAFPDAVNFTLRQLLRLRDVDGNEEYDLDDLLEGL